MCKLCIFALLNIYIYMDLAPTYCVIFWNVEIVVYNAGPALYTLNQIKPTLVKRFLLVGIVLS